MGDTQPLSDGGAFVGWGSERYFSEYDSSGKLRFEGILPEPDRSYRAQLEPWEGMPETKPAAAARPEVGDEGLRELERRHQARLLARARREHLRRGDASPRERTRSGFETSIPVPSGYASFEVLALDSAGHPLATSSPFSPS